MNFRTCTMQTEFPGDFGARDAVVWANISARVVAVDLDWSNHNAGRVPVVLDGDAGGVIYGVPPQQLRLAERMKTA